MHPHALRQKIEVVGTAIETFPGHNHEPTRDRPKEVAMHTLLAVFDTNQKLIAAMTDAPRPDSGCFRRDLS
jgi:hypothetical protein